MAKIIIDSSRVIGKIKPMHAVGQPPIGGLGKSYFQHFHYLTEIGTPYSRLHDVGGAYGKCQFVDIPNIFRDFDADENDPASYDFTFTDALITALVNAGIEPYYRLGVTIENQAEIKSYHIDPPKDYGKWVRICEHVIAHYIDGWADGFHYNLRYWEIWNEPDDGLRVSQMWNGTKEDYYRLYETAAKHLKSVFGDRIKVGGYASISLQAAVFPEKYKDDVRMQYFAEFFFGFLAHVKKTGAPLDFYSWHSYNPTKATVAEAKWIRQQLDEHGFTAAESHLNEWNPFADQRGTAHHSAEVAAMMLAMQDAPLDVLMIYDARLCGSVYAALFDPYTCKPFHAYYALAAFNRLYRLGNQIACTSEREGVYAAAASDGKHGALMISNLSGASVPLEIGGADLTDARWYVLDQPRLLSWSAPVHTLENNQVVLVEW